MSGRGGDTVGVNEIFRQDLLFSMVKLWEE